MGLQEKEMEIGFAGFLFCIEWNGMEEKERKNESGNILAGQAGGCVGWYEKICGERLLPAGAGREVVDDRKVWCSVKNQAGKVLSGCDRKGVCRLARMPGVTVLPAGAG